MQTILNGFFNFSPPESILFLFIERLFSVFGICWAWIFHKCEADVLRNILCLSCFFMADVLNCLLANTVSFIQVEQSIGTGRLSRFYCVVKIKREVPWSKSTRILYCLQGPLKLASLFVFMHLSTNWLQRTEFLASEVSINVAAWTMFLVTFCH